MNPLQTVRSAVAAGRARLRSVSSVGFVSVAVIGLIVAMFLADGFRARTYDLQNPAVWVTRDDGSLVGRFNTQALQIDSAIPSEIEGVDVAQDGGDIVVFAPGSMRAVNAATEELSAEPIELPGRARVELAGGRYVIADQDGKAWTGNVDEVTSWDPGRKPDLRADGAALVTIGRNGTIVGWSSKDGVATVIEADGGRSTVELAAATDVVEPQIALAGSTPVLLDASTGTLFLPGATPVDLSQFGDVQLQLSGDDEDVVVAATTSGLVTVKIGGGEPQLSELDADVDAPIRPARINGCTYGAWAAPAFMSVNCGGGGSASGPLDKVGGTSAEDLRFRVNRNNVALNQLSTGLVAVRNGDRIEEIEGDWAPRQEPTSDEMEEDLDPEVKSINLEQDQEPPVALDDSAGARRNRSSIASVLDNDSDPNGDIITIDPDQLVVPPSLEVSVVSQGQALQITPRSEAGASETFTYRITDGFAMSDPATVTVNVASDDENSAPVPKSARGVRQRSFSVQMGTPGSYEVLPDWEDPEGDPIVLLGAEPDDPATGQAQTIPAGRLTFTATAGASGLRALAVTVADVPPARLAPQSDTGSLKVEVLGAGQEIGPKVEPDYATGLVGSNITVHPLRNDVDPNGDPLMITRLIPPKDGWGSDPAPTFSPEDGTVVVRSSRAGTLLFGYEVTDRTETAQALIRVDVVDPQTNRPPSAGPDLVLLPPDQDPRTVDLLANDWDPDGDVMMVSGLRMLDGPRVRMQLLEHRRVRVWSEAPLSSSATVEYTVSDGASQSTGQLTIAQSPVALGNTPPIVGADTATVRAGDLVTIPVLANDIDPDGDTLRLAPELQIGPEAGQGAAFVSGSVVRFVAPNTPGTVRLAYGVTDDGLAWSSGQIEITVRTAQDNSPPRPITVEARVLAGNSTRVVIPLTGIDPDGDSVGLVGLSPEEPPELGRVRTPVGTDSIEYEAFKPVTGTTAGGRDQFAYRVRDSRGGEATGIVRIVVAPRTASNPPQPEDDPVSIRPGGSVTVAVLDNDFDPDGDPIELAAPALGEIPEGLRAEVLGNRVLLTATGDEGPVAPLIYYVTDGPASQPVSGAIEVTITPDAEGLPPIARDDVARFSDPGAERISVDVRSNDSDPDGDVDELAVDVLSPADTPVESGDVVVTPASDPRVVVYRVTDPQKLAAAAVVRVPSAGDLADLPPEARLGAGPITVTAGEPHDIVVAQRVVDPEGEPVQLTHSRFVTASKGTVDTSTEGTIRYTADAAASGQAAVMFEVTDGADANTGNKVTFSVPITVKRSADAPPQPPVVLPANPVRLGPGDEPFTVDLVDRLDPDSGDIDDVSFELDGEPGGDVSAGIDDRRLTITAGKDAQPGTTVTVSFTASRGDLEAPGSVEVQIVDSSRPPVTCTVQDVTDASAGEEVSIDVLSNCTNPFPDDDLELIRAVDDQGFGARLDGSTIRFTPPDGYVGTATVTYDVSDAADRISTGVVRVTVRDVPGAPGAPTVVDVSSRQVVLSWTPPKANGAEITKYLVVASNLSPPFDCGTSTTCTVTGLTNDTEYRFSVKAENDVGEGPAGPSAPARPDQRPEPPALVELTFDKRHRDGKLVASWSRSQTEGSHVVAYEIELSSPDLSGRSIISVVGSNNAPPPTQHVIEGLRNGTEYSIRVRAKNKAATAESDWSSPSNADSPATIPDAPVSVTVGPVSDPLGERIEVRWSPGASDGGAEVLNYRVDALRVGTSAVHKSLEAAGNQSMPFVVDLENTADKFQVVVTATNKAGESAASAPSAEVQAPRAPDAVGQIGVTDHIGDGTTGLDRRLALTFARPATGGTPITHYLVSPTAGAPGVVDRQYNVQESDTQPRLVVDGLINGVGHRFTIKACNAAYCSESSGPSPVGTPYGPVGQPSTSVVSISNTEVIFSVAPPAPNGRNIDRIEVAGAESIGDGQYRAVGGCAQTLSISAVAFDVVGQRSVAATPSASTSPCPSVAISLGDRTTQGGCVQGDAMATGFTQGCYFVRISMSNFGPGNHTVRCYMTMSTLNPAVYQTVTRSGNGTFQDCSFSSAGRWVMVVVDGVIQGGNSSLDQYGWAVNHHTGYISNLSQQWPTN